MKRIIILTGIIFIFACSFMKVYAAPDLVNYQGKLTDNNGLPLDGTYEILFKIYNVVTGGTEIWTQTINPVTVAHGHFNVILSNGITNAFSGDTRYIGLTVPAISVTEISPRQQILSTPFAIRADYAGEIGNDSVTSDKILNGEIKTEDIGNGEVYSTDIYDGEVKTADIDNYQITQAKLKTSSGTAYFSGALGIYILPGGQYGFYPQMWVSSTNGDCIVTASMAGNSPTFYTGIQVSSLFDCDVFNTTVQMRQRYVTSSGEVHWIFILKAKKDYEMTNSSAEIKKVSAGTVIAMWEAPDHPCFGNSGKPDLVQHPFPDFNPDKHEIIVINPTLDEVEEIRNRGITGVENQPDRSFLEVLATDYEIDTSDEPAWPTKAVTVGLPNFHNWQRRSAESLETIKKTIPKPVMVRTAKLKKNR